MVDYYLYLYGFQSLLLSFSLIGIIKLNENNSFLIKILFEFIFCFSELSYLFAKELNFKALEILTYEEGNLIVGKEEAEAKIEKELEIYADKFTYDRKKEILIAEGNVKTFDLINNIKIEAEKISYDKINNQIISYKKTFFQINDKYKITSEDVNFLINEQIIFSNQKTFFRDFEDNQIQLKTFRYFDELKY